MTTTNSQRTQVEDVDEDGGARMGFLDHLDEMVAMYVIGIGIAWLAHPKANPPPAVTAPRRWSSWSRPVSSSRLAAAGPEPRQCGSRD